MVMGSTVAAATEMNSKAQGWKSSGDTGQNASMTTPFAGLLKSMVEQTSRLEQQASAAVTGLLNGEGGDIHQAMIATQKADMAFELALQVRNKAVGAYQQMMNMQF
ncbi:flagellar hook-basal body complex protein FliE [Edaphobacter albus]|uniref:flagellar hook-basal body complex protein FliE n=1 Tax=Edaphobacter sp. 4G125 TaxID=2763071 RepID=UPI0016488AC6|nr:flagellar hook-basal body complex protein FliE [Edaphobacter sp. 4G125]QNI35266.1 flagellar hook-basal body complex protein FliE [Edaphobacter sp. 4G125]